MLHNLDVDQLKSFLAVADLGSFTRAADQVNKTQSAVSMQMKRLEDALGRPLFAKDGRGIRFTADGERLIDYARRIVALSDEAVSAFTKPDVTGTVRFGTPDDYADFFLPEVLGRFAKSHPRVTVDVECLQSGTLIERTRSGEIDLSLITFAGQIEGETLRTEELVWATSARHSLHLLEEIPLAVSHAGCCWRRITMDAMQNMGRRYRIAYSSPNSTTINMAVMQGLAIAPMPRMCVRPGMRILTETEGFPPLERFEIGLIRKPGSASKAVEALAQHVRESLAHVAQLTLAA